MDLLHDTGQVRIARTRADINDNDPIRIAIELGSPREVMVLMTARTPSGGSLVAIRCYNVTGVVEHELLLVGPLDPTLDADSDGFPELHEMTCFDPNGDGFQPCRFSCPEGVGADCNDTDATIYPGAPDMYCGDGVDQDCDGVDLCGDADGDGYDKCAAGTDDPSCDCNDADENIYPGAPEMCGDGVDQSCDGMDDLCDRDGDGFPADRETGGTPDCDDTNPMVNPGASEVCTPDGGTSRDEDCDGLLDELSTCAGPDVDGDGAEDCSVSPGATCDCNDCDPGVRPSAREICGNGVDENCDGTDAVCASGDADRDGETSRALGGGDCDDANPQVRPGAPERCGDSIDQDCDTRIDEGCPAEDTDRDGWVEAAECENSNAGTPYATETCNDVDDDCDGQKDEVLSPPATSPSGQPLPHGLVGCVQRGMCSMPPCQVDFLTDPVNCGGCRVSCDTIGDRCVDGVCDCESQGGTGPCTPGTTCCAGAGCHDLRNELAHCGACGGDCNAGRPGQRPSADRCAGGSCMCGSGPACGTDAYSACCSTAGAMGCVDTRTSLQHCGGCGIQCGANQVCDNGVCTCIPGRLDCSTADGCETDPAIDLMHCGGCGRTCARAHANAMCVGGVCSTGGCVGEWQNCNMIDGDGCETSLRTASNCGSCGNVCTLANAVATCPTGTCQIESCNTGWADCNGRADDGCETSVRSLTSCGGCGVPCARDHAAESCTTGVCTLGACDPGWGNCDGNATNGCETDLGVTVAHCGTCGNNCGANAVCVSGGCMCAPSYLDCTGDGPGCGTAFGTSACGACGAVCSPGESCDAGGRCACGGTTGSAGTGAVCRTPNDRCCGSTCVDSDLDEQNCGGCGRVCGPSEVCNAQRCTCGPESGGVGAGAVCSMSETCCGPAGCVTTSTSTAHCGGCGVTCGANESCSGGRCQCGGTSGSVGGGAACSAGRSCCGGACVDTSTDEANCGMCGRTCGAGETCSGGVCTCGSGAACGAGQTCCGGTCRTTSTDTANCGGCGIACNTNETCMGGRCCCGSSCATVGSGQRCTSMMGNRCCPMENMCRSEGGSC